MLDVIEIYRTFKERSEIYFLIKKSNVIYKKKFGIKVLTESGIFPYFLKQKKLFKKYLS